MATSSGTEMSSGLVMQEEVAMRISSSAHQKGPGREREGERERGITGLEILHNHCSPTSSDDPGSHDGLGEGHMELHSKEPS